MNTPRNEDVSNNPTVQALLEQAVRLWLEQHGFNVECATVNGVECARVIRPEGTRK